jgi:hypothetical protein
MYGKKVLLHGNAPPLVGKKMDANTIRAEFPEAFKLRCRHERAGQVFGLADVDPVMACPAIGAVIVGTLRDEIYGSNRFEPRFQGPHLKVVRFARFPAESNVSVFHESAVI